MTITVNPEMNDNGVAWLGAPDWEDWVWVDCTVDPEKPVSQLLEAGGEDVVRDMAFTAAMFLTNETGPVCLALAFFEFCMTFYLDVLEVTDEFIKDRESGEGDKLADMAGVFEEAARRLRAAIPAV